MAAPASTSFSPSSSSFSKVRNPNRCTSRNCLSITTGRPRGIGISGDTGQDPDAEAFEERFDLTHLTRQIVFADHVDVGSETGAITGRTRGQRSPVILGIALAGDRSMDRMGHISDRLKCNLGAIKSTIFRRCARNQLFGKSFFRSFSDLPWFLSQPGSLQTAWILRFRLAMVLHSFLINTYVPNE